MKITIAIDAYHIVGSPRSSLAIYANELVVSLNVKPEVEKIYLLCPFPIPENFVYKELQDLDKVEFVIAPFQKKYKNEWLVFTSWIQFGMVKLIKKFKEKIDYLISPYHQTALRMPKNIKVATVIHDVCSLDTRLYPMTKKGYYEHYFNFLTSSFRSQALIPISDFTKIEFSKIYPRASKKITNVVYNNVSSPEIEEDYMAEVLAKYNLKKHDYYFALANLHLRKGIDLILGSYQLYREKGGSKPLVLLAPPNHHNAFRNMMRDYKVDVSWVMLLADMTTSERDALYKGAICLLFPSRCEGFGYPIVEAMIQGCPPIAWKNTPAREILDRGEYLLQNLDINEIHQKMLQYESLSEEERLQEAEYLKSRSRYFNTKDYGERFFQAMIQFDKKWISVEK